jgi:hypothetical protein
MPATTQQQNKARPKPPRARLAAPLLALLLLAGCTSLAMEQQEFQDTAPASGVDPAYDKFVATQLKQTFKDLSSFDSFEISQARWLQSSKGWAWLACVRFNDRGHQRSYAVYFKDSKLVDSRFAVQSDGCSGLSYAPLDLNAGGPRPRGAGDPGPLY